MLWRLCVTRPLAALSAGIGCASFEDALSGVAIRCCTHGVKVRALWTT